MNEFKEKSLLAHVVFYRFSNRIFILCISLFASLFGLLSPFFQKAFVDVLTGQKSMHLLNFTLSSSALTNILLAFGATLISQACSLYAIYCGAREGFFIQKNLGNMIYKKMLSLRRDTFNNKSVGEVISIYATDVASATTLLEQTLPLGGAILFPVILAPLFIHAIYDVPLMPILITMTVLIFFHLLLSVRQSRFFFRFKQLAAERSGLVNEWIQNIRSLRILAWTAYFEKKIFAKRIEETSNRIDMVTNSQVGSSFASSGSFFINISGMISMVYLSPHPVTPGEILALLWIFGVFLTRPFRVLPWVFTFAFDSYSSIKRVEHFLKLGDLSENFQDQEIFKGSRVAIKQKSPDLKIVGLNLKFQNQKILDNIDLEVKSGEFLAIVGEVGSGKSLLLFSLMREVAAQFKEFKIGNEDMLKLQPEQTKDFFTFVSQDGFVMSSSLRENIVFEYEAPKSFDENVTAALKQAEFDIVRENLRDGLETEIGERGVNLSGGQRQRISLARAVFFDRPIVLLDDSLSAVDVDTERALVKKLLLGLWKNQTRILVSHRLSVLKHVDRIVFLENGKISDIGTFDQLMRRSAAFKNFTASNQQVKDEAAHEVREFVVSPPIEVTDIEGGVE